MKFILNEDTGLEHFLNKACSKSNNGVLKLNPEFGEGHISLYNLQDGLTLYIFDFILSEPLLIKWEYKDFEKSEYYIFHNISGKPQKPINNKEKTIEEGAVVFTRNNQRRRVWMPNVRYHVLSLSFNQNWYENINAAIVFPKQIQDNLKYTNDLYLRATPTSSSALAASQIINQLDKKVDISIPYLRIKAIELTYLLLTDTLRNVSELKTRSSIHPNDLAKLNEFMGSINKQLDRIPDITEAAKELGMSPSKFQRLFKSLMSNSYYNYVYKLKMDAAMEFLLQGLTVSDVAYKVGYSSIGNFTNAFKKCFHLLPSEIYKTPQL